MRTTRIGQLTIHRTESWAEFEAGWPRRPKPGGGMTRNQPGVLLSSHGPGDEELLARVNCMGLIDDEGSSEAARSAHTVVVLPLGAGMNDAPEGELMQPLAACVAKKTRSIEARQTAIAAGFYPEETPLVGVPVATEVLANEAARIRS